jgi:hypothetical protein
MDPGSSPSRILRRHMSDEFLKLRRDSRPAEAMAPVFGGTGASFLFWLTLRRLWSRWARVLLMVNPETVVSWHRADPTASASTRSSCL